MGFLRSFHILANIRQTSLKRIRFMSSQKGNSFLVNIKQTNLQNFFMVFQESNFPFESFFLPILFVQNSWKTFKE